MTSTCALMLRASRVCSAAGCRGANVLASLAIISTASRGAATWMAGNLWLHLIVE